MKENAFFSIIYRTLNVIFPLITYSYASHVIFAEGVGQYSYAQNIVSYFTMLASLGIPSYGIKVIAQNSNSKEQKSKKFAELFVLNFFATLVSSLIFIIYLIGVHKNVDIKILFICGLLIPLNCINIDWFFQGEEEYKYIAIRSAVVKIFSLLSIFIFVRKQSDYINFALINVIGIAGNYFLNILNLPKYLCKYTEKKNILTHIKPISILFFQIIAGTLYNQIDITMLGIMHGSIFVGNYCGAVKIINSLVSFVNAITAVFLPRLSKIADNKDEYDKLLCKGVSIISVIVFPIYAGIILVSDSIVNVLYGDTFTQTSIVMKILSVMIIIRAFGDLLGYQVAISRNKENIFLYIFGIATVMNVILNYYLIPKWACVGAALASVITEAIVNIGMIIVLRKEYRLSSSIKPILHSIFASIFMFLSVEWITQFFHTDIVILCVSIIIGIIIYGGIICLLNWKIIKRKLLKL